MNGPKKVSSKKKLVSESIYESLRAMIAERRFKPGQRVNVEELARDLGVSRTPVWEAVRRLGQDGIFRNEPNRGVFMAEHPLERVCATDCRFAVRWICLPAGWPANEFPIRPLTSFQNACPINYAQLRIRMSIFMCNRTIAFICSSVKPAVTLYLKTSMTPLLRTYCQRPIILRRCFPAIYLVHQEIVAALSDRDPNRVDSAVTRHGEILIANLENQIKSEADHKKLIRQIKSGQTPS